MLLVVGPMCFLASNVAVSINGRFLINRQSQVKFLPRGGVTGSEYGIRTGLSRIQNLGKLKGLKLVKISFVHRVEVKTKKDE
jgi:hypothetical protein